MTEKCIPAGQFKTHCLALLDEVRETGHTLVVTKRGVPVARLVPVEEPAPIMGSVTQCEDLLAPAVPEQDWEMLNE